MRNNWSVQIGDLHDSSDHETTRSVHATPTYDQFCCIVVAAAVDYAGGVRISFLTYHVWPHSTYGYRCQCSHLQAPSI